MSLPQSMIGHNRPSENLRIEIRLFNSLTAFAGAEGTHRSFAVPAGTTIGDLARQLKIPISRIFLVLVNGRDVTPGLVGDQIREGYQVEEGDVVSFSGPVPYSYGYGAPVV